MSKELFIASSPHETKVAVLEDDLLVEVYYERDTDVGLVGGIYKGRVNRVLPGMQSAFVDIGLERDAFLYVSDFFLEDQEEYDKIFDEAEARATRITTEETLKPAAPAASLTETAAPPPVLSSIAAPSPELAEAVAAPADPPAPAASARVHESVEPRPVPLATQFAAPVLPVQAPATQGPPSPSSPYAGRPGEFRRPGQGEFRRDDHRGRRRRRGRGRPFGDQKFSERKFVPRPAENAPAQGFELLPGESLAKYSHGASAPPRPTPTEGAAGDVLTAEPNREAQLETSGREAAPAPEWSQPRVDAALNETPSPVEPPERLGDSTRPGEPLLTPDEADRVISEFAAAVQPGPDARPYAASPFARETMDIPATHESASDQGSEWQPAGEAQADSNEEPESQSAPDAEESFAFSSEAENSSSVESVEDSLELEAGGEVAIPAEVEAGGQEEPPAAPGAAPAGPADRSYTMRDQHQRPHFAPRRGPRGRRGPGGGRPPRQGGRPERSRPPNSPAPQIAQLLKEGQEILVQIAKEPLGTKGARITSHIALPGRYLVFMPTIDHIGVSRKISSEQERLRLRNIILENKGPMPGGFIVRTAGEGRPEEEIKADLRFLSTLWADIRGRSDRTKAPALIHRDLSLVQRVLRDTLSPDFKTVRLDNESEYERVVEFVSRCQPGLAGHVKLYTRDTPLFEEFGVEAEIEKALKPKVWLKSGGYIVINQTEALVAIDVNTGKYVGKTNRLEDTILKTNVDAVNEIVRQIRLRDLGGIIVIDFIDMDERRNRIKVIQALEEALRHDRAPTKVTSFHDFGLVAITRKRVKQSLERTLCERCGYCAGAGWVKSVTTVCYEILAEARKMSGQIEGETITLRVNPEVARGLKSRDAVLIREFEALTHKDVIIKIDPAIHQERFEIF